MKKIALLVEFGNAHSETLYAQLRFLKWAGYQTILVCSPKLMPQVRSFDVVDDFWECPVGKGLFASWKAALQLRRFILKSGVSLVVFNTAQNEAVRNLCLLPFPKPIRFTGTLHNLRKLGGSITQRIISRRVKRYFLLAHYLKEKVSPAAKDRLDFEVYYPMFFQSYPPVPVDPKPAGTFWIAIPGVVEYARRDYEGIARALAALETRPNVCFLLLGSAFHPQGNGREFVQLIEELGVSRHFRLWDGYVDNATFHTQVQACDAVMLGIHPTNADYEDYIERQISGTWNLAFAYQKPLLLAEGFAALRDFKETGIFYNPETLGKFLGSLPAVLAAAPQRPYAGSEWSFETQAERYIRFVAAEGHP